MGCGALIGAALGLAGAGVQEVANSKTQGKMNDIMAAQQAEQKKLQAKGKGVFDASLAASTPDAAKQSVALGADKFLNAANTAQAVPLGLAAPALTGANTAADKVRGGLDARAMANYAGYGQYAQDQSLKDQAANRQLGVINQQSQYANSMLPAELGAAQNDYNSLRGVGSLLGTAGSLVGLGSSLGIFGQSPMAGRMDARLGQSATNLAQSPLASPLWMGQVAPQQPRYTYNFGF